VRGTRLCDYVHVEQQDRPELSEIFTTIYGNNTWGGGSGPGSFTENVQPYIEFLQAFIDDRDICTIVDCGCGDWQFARLLDLSKVNYIGYDIVPSVIEANRSAFKQPNVEFRCADFSSADLPPADLVICKDALQHLPNTAVLQLLAQLPKFKYALLTNDLGPNHNRDNTIQSGRWHDAPIDLTQPPFAVAGRQVLQLTRPGWRAKATVLVERPEVPISAETAPRVLMAILAKQKEPVLPFYLECIEALEYPKSAISLYVRTNNNTDRTGETLRQWVERVGPQYEHVEFDDTDVPDEVQRFDVHEWNPLRFKVLAGIRQESVERAVERDCDFYFVADVDNFIRPNVLGELVALDLPIVSPLLRHVDPTIRYSNYNFAVGDNGYYVKTPHYYSLLYQTIRGVCEVDVAHCTYLVRRSSIPRLRYADGTARHEYVIFSESARRNGVPQYLDNRQIYGYLTHDENPSEARRLLGAEIAAALSSRERS
jgi:SAM-dependent methyltransferase